MSNRDLEQELDTLLDDIRSLIDEGTETAMEEPAAPAAEVPVQHQEHWTQHQRVPKHVERLQKNQEQAYADWLYAQGRGEAVPHISPPAGGQNPPAQEKKKKGRVFRGILACLLILLLLVSAAAAAVAFLLPKQPVCTEAIEPRRSGVSTILLVGTDQGGTRTDTLMLLTVDQTNRRTSLVSIPRDTLVKGSYAVPKINSVYGVNLSEGYSQEEAVEMLLTRVSQCVGFRPDGYILVELEAFVELVDAMGGVTFDVPVDMYYNDPSQDLYIDLSAGEQTLSGKEAMGVVRYRSGYTDADLGRVSVQRDFLSAAIRQGIRPESILKWPQLLQLLRSRTESDLSAANYLWLARTALLTDLNDIQTVTLPGSARNWESGSYYVLDASLTAQTVNAYCNPYEQPITEEDLDIRIN